MLYYNKFLLGGEVQGVRDQWVGTNWIIAIYPKIQSHIGVSEAIDSFAMFRLSMSLLRKPMFVLLF